MKLLLSNRSDLKYGFVLALLVFSSPVFAQVTFTPNTDTTQQLGAWARMEIVNGDTTFVMSLRPVRITARWKFTDLQQQRQYYLYTRAARKVYPYAIQAVGLYEDIQDETGKIPPRLVDIHTEFAQLVLSDLHVLNINDYEKAGRYLLNPHAFDFYKLMDWEFKPSAVLRPIEE